MAVGEHKQVHIEKGDVVIISARTIPGNERAIAHLIDNLYRRGAEVPASDGLPHPHRGRRPGGPENRGEPRGTPFRPARRADAARLALSRWHESELDAGG